MTDKQVDPRYDPVFQPGFDGQVVKGLTRRPEPAAPASAATPTIDALRPVPRPDPYAPHDDFLTAMRDAAASEAPRLADADVPEPRSAPPARPVWRNPFLIVVALIGAALIGIGISGMNAVATQGGFSSADSSYLYFVFMQFGGPMLVVLGIATLVGVVFFLALQWQRGRL